MAWLAKSYLYWLQRRPLVTQATTTGLTMALGDAVAQVFVERRKNYDASRTSRFFLYGLFITGPCLRGWYLFLERVFRKPSRLQPLYKVLADQLVFSPPFLAAFLFNMTLWRTHSVDVAKDKVKQDFYPVIVANYQLWPLVQIVNFSLVPLQHRVFVVNCVAVLWNTYLAYQSERAVHLKNEEAIEMS